MIRLDLEREPSWLDRGHGVRLHVRHCTTAPAARAAVARGVDARPDDARLGATAIVTARSTSGSGS